MIKFGFMFLFFLKIIFATEVSVDTSVYNTIIDTSRNFVDGEVDSTAFDFPLDIFELQIIES